MKEFEHGGNLRNIESNIDLVDFSANINPYGTPKSVDKALKEALLTISHYPEPDSLELKKIIGEKYHLQEDNLIIGNGAIELIYLATKVLEPENVLIIGPTFSEYERAAQGENAHINYVFLDEDIDFKNPMRDIIIKIKNNNLLYICNPNNPTGTIYTKEEMEMLITHAESCGCFVIVDESFMDFIKNKEEFSVLPLVNKCHNLLVLTSLTKFYAIAGLRLGFAAADKEVIEHLHKGKDPWNVNILAQIGGKTALLDEKYAKRSRAYTRGEINYLYEELLEFKDLKVYEPSVNFILINIKKTDMTSSVLREKLIKEGIVIRNCENYKGLGDYFVRVAVRTREENDLLIDALEKILK